MTICKSVALSALLFSVVYIFKQQFVGSDHEHYTNVLLRAAVTTVGVIVASTIFKWTIRSHQNEMVLQIAVRTRLARSSSSDETQSGGTTITAVQETLRADHEGRSELVI